MLRTAKSANVGFSQVVQKHTRRTRRVVSNDAPFRDYIAALQNSEGSFQETAPKKHTKNTVQHCGGGGGSMVANHRGGGESSMVVTTLHIRHIFCLLKLKKSCNSTVFCYWTYLPAN